MKPRLKSYSHLPSGTMSSDYDVVTSQLLYLADGSPDTGHFELSLPLDDWYQRYQRRSKLSGCNWESFKDPRATTYASYVALAHRIESHLDQVMAYMERTGVDQRVDPAWLDVQEAVLAPLRYAVHGLQMSAAYTGSMAPSGKIVVTLLFQAADEGRRIQRIAMRLAQVRGVRPDFGQASRALWEEHPAWQGWRRLVERLLVTFDWAESLVRLNLLVKALLDPFVNAVLTEMAQRFDDQPSAQILASMADDCHWHRSWTADLLRLAFTDRPENRGVIETWRQDWLSDGREALLALLSLANERARERALPESFLEPILADWERSFSSDDLARAAA